MPFRFRQINKGTLNLTYFGINYLIAWIGALNVLPKLT